MLDSNRVKRLPAELPQQTYAEAKALAIALTDGPTGRYWGFNRDGSGNHQVPKSNHYVKLNTRLLPDYMRVVTEQGAKEVLQETGIPAVVLLNAILGLLRDEESKIIPVGLLRQACGIRCKSRLERQKADERVIRQLHIIAALEVYGCRKETYPSKGSKGQMNLNIDGPLIKIGVHELDVEIRPGAWLRDHQGDNRILSYWGDINAIAKIPAGKPSGAWAKSIALALNQVIREKAAKHLDDLKVSRRQLLTMFSPEPPFEVEKHLYGKHPRRARSYFDDAVRTLQERGIIESCCEERPLPNCRESWQEDWLDQKLIITVNQSNRDAMSEIARRAESKSKAAI